MLRDFAFRVDQKGLPVCHAKQSGQAAEHAVGFGDAFVGVCQEWKGQTAFLTEFRVRRARVGADADHDCAQGLEFWERLLEFVGFNAATGRVVLRVKVQDCPSPAQAREGDCLAIVGDGGEIWGGLSNHVRSLPTCWMPDCGRRRELGSRATLEAHIPHGPLCRA
jgi:hypothetical protein